MKELMERNIELIEKISQLSNQNPLGVRIAEIDLIGETYRGIIECIHKGYEILGKVGDYNNILTQTITEIMKAPEDDTEYVNDINEKVKKIEEIVKENTEKINKELQNMKGEINAMGKYFTDRIETHEKLFHK